MVPYLTGRCQPQGGLDQSVPENEADRWGPYFLKVLKEELQPFMSSFPSRTAPWQLGSHSLSGQHPVVQTCRLQPFTIHQAWCLLLFVCSQTLSFASGTSYLFIETASLLFIARAASMGGRGSSVQIQVGFEQL